MAKAKRRPLRTLKSPAVINDSEDSTHVIWQAATIMHPLPAKLPRKLARAQEKHRTDHLPVIQPTSTPHQPTLADRFYALPGELREHVFALLLVRPVKWDLEHLPACQLRSLPPNADIRPGFCSTTCGSPGKHWRNQPNTPVWRNPWRSAYAPPVQNPFLCSDCWDRDHRARPYPPTWNMPCNCPRLFPNWVCMCACQLYLPCLCARRRNLDILLVCRRWHEEAGRVFYSRNTFAFEVASTCVAFFSSLRQKWRDIVTGVSLQALHSHAAVPDDNKSTLASPKRLPQVWCLLRTLPSLTHVELPAQYLVDVKIVLPLLRLGPKKLSAVRFVLEMPTQCLKAVESGHDHAYIWPRNAHRILLRGGAAEQVGRVLKGQPIAWAGLDKVAKRQVLQHVIECHRVALAKISGAEDVQSLSVTKANEGYVVDCGGIGEWERLWRPIGYHHAFFDER